MPSEPILSTTNKRFSFDTNIVLGTAIVGLFVLILPLPSGSIYGYGLLFFTLLGMLMLHLALETKLNMEAGLFKILKNMLFASQTLPIIGIMIIIGWLFSLNIKWYDRFTKPNTLPNEFLNFKSLSTGLLFISFLLIKTITDDETKESVGKTKSNNPLVAFYKYASESATAILYLIIMILAIIVALMQVILQYYLTDG